MSRKNKEEEVFSLQVSLPLVPVVHRMTSRTLRKRLSGRKSSSQPRAKEKLVSTATLKPCVLRKTRKTGHNTKKKNTHLSSKPLKNEPTTTNNDNHNAIVSCSNPTTPSPSCVALDDNEAQAPLTETDGDIIMCAKTRQQKEKLQVARQKQLEDMKAREAAEAREERCLKRNGLWTEPVKKLTNKKVSWNADIALCNYQQVV